MTDVSCRAFSYFTVAAERGLLDLDAILAGLPVTRAELENPTNRIEWELWARMCDRAAEQLGHDPVRLGDSGALVAETGERGFAGYLAPVASLFASAEEMLDLVVRWGGPSLYRSHTFSMERMIDGRLRFVATLRPGLRPCEAWFRMIPGALRVLPRFMGQPEAVVELESISPTSASYLMTLPPARTWRARLRQTWAALRSSRAVGEELVFQQRQLLGTLEALRRAEGGFRAALDALPAFVLLHQSGRILYANPSLCAALGRSASELTGEPVSSIVHAEDRSRFEAEVTRDDADEPSRRALRFVDARGELVFVEARTVPAFDFGGRRARGLFAVDVTERVRMEETNRLLLSSLPDLVVRLGRDGRLLDVQAGTELSQQAAALRALLGACAWDLAGFAPGVLEEHIHRARATIEAALETGLEQRLELSSDLGELRVFELRAMPREGGAEALVVVRDVTAQRRMDRQLAISERMSSVGTLAAGMAHEINNPLTYVLGNQEELAHGLEALARGEHVDLDDLRALLDDAREGARRVRDIVASLRTFSRVEAAVAPRPLDPVAAFERAIAMCANELRHRAVLKRELERVPSVLGDESRLVQVLVNLLVNAAQALPEGSPRENEIRVVSRTDPDGRVRLEVHDTGTGMPPEVLRRVFDPFFTTKPPGAGTGLGLSISHRIVHDLGGELVAASSTGEGSCFTVLLPSVPDATPDEARPATPSSEPARVLVVDDEPAVARALAATLHRDGHAVTTATGAEEALAELARGTFDLVLCDLMMPGISGAELHARVGATDPELAKKFAFITGGAFSDASREIVERSKLPVLTKPPDPDALRACLAEALRRR